MDSVRTHMAQVQGVLEGMKGKTVVFWGAGRRLHSFMQEYCRDRNVLPLPDYICESTRPITESHIEGIPVLDIADLKKLDSGNTVIVLTAGLLDLQAQVITNELYYYPMYHCRSFEAYCFLEDRYQDYQDVLGKLADDHSRQVLESLFVNLLNGSLWCQSLYEPAPYFGNDVVGDLKDEGCVVLAGAFNGKHIDRALANNPNVRVHAFEPNATWFDFLVKKYEARPNVTIHNKILWDKAGKLEFDASADTHGLDAHVFGVEDGVSDAAIESAALDSEIEEKTALISLDVEGAEQRVIQGATKTILEQRPILTICLYHSLDDYLRIPLILSEMQVEVPYRLFVKQHSCITAIETVLYAV